VLTTSNVQAVSQANQATDEKNLSSDDWLGEIRKGLKKKKNVKEFTQKEQSSQTEEESKDDHSKKEDVPQTVIQSIDSSIAAKRCSALPEGKQGLEALKEYWERNIKLIDVFANGALRVSGEDEIAKRYTSDDSIIKVWMINEGIKIFRFKPKEAGLLCLDIDCKNDKDGVKDLFSFFKSQGKEGALLPKIFQEFPNNFPCWVATASGGYHLYFKVPAEVEMKKSCALLAGYPSLEILYEKAPNVAGSYKDGKPYVLYGSFDNIPNLPQVIQTAIDSPKDKQQSKINPVQKNQKKFNTKKKNGNRTFGKPSGDNVVKQTEDFYSGIFTGRNDKAFKLALNFRYNGYEEDETLQWLLNDHSVNTLPEREIESTVKSAYKYNQ
jgi:hypothetical protein